MTTNPKPPSHIATDSRKPRPYLTSSHAEKFSVDGFGGFMERSIDLLSACRTVALKEVPHKHA